MVENTQVIGRILRYFQVCFRRLSEVPHFLQADQVIGSIKQTVSVGEVTVSFSFTCRIRKPSEDSCLSFFSTSVTGSPFHACFSSLTAMFSVGDWRGAVICAWASVDCRSHKRLPSSADTGLSKQANNKNKESSFFINKKYWLVYSSAG